MKRYKLKKAPIPIKGLEKVYTVYSNGDIVRNSTGNVLKPRPNWAGYMQVHLRYRDINRVVAVHRMVALAFIKKPNGDYQVDHKDNNKANNAVENLQWLTAQENIIKAFKQGRPHPKGNSKTDRRGHRSPVAKLNEKQVLEIKEMLSSGTIRNREIAKVYNVSEQLICNIKKGRNYAY